MHARNLGKGAAVRTALQRAEGTFAAILDADLEYAAADIGPLLEPLLSGDANVVFGSRAFTSQSSFSFWYVMGNKGVTFATNVIYNCWISDIMTCHKVMRGTTSSIAPASRTRVRDRAGDHSTLAALGGEDPRSTRLVPCAFARER